jgi:hypothetical protein
MKSVAASVLAILFGCLLNACDDSAERGKLEEARRRVQSTIAQAEREAAAQGGARTNAAK